jgi:peptidoglycan/xylan/chitin deacetylase (PgdA/CDA1 family)
MQTRRAAPETTRPAAEFLDGHGLGLEQDHATNSYKDSRTMKLPAHGRYRHSAITSRPTYEWPNGARLALVVCNNIEHFAYRAGLGSDSAQPGAPQGSRNYAWRDYGNRVGLWNQLEMLDELGLPCAHNVNSAALDTCPEIAPALLARGDEFVGHGRSNAERQDGMWEEDERRLIQETRDGVARHSGSAPQGWLGPYLAQSSVTLDLLREEGFTYVMDWPADDQPFWMTTRAGPILSVPYSIELNDSPAMVFRHHTGREFAEMIVDQFDEMLEQSRRRPLVCSIVLHTFLVGQPFRLRPLRQALQHILSHRDRLWVTRPGELARYVATLPKGVVPGSEMLA